MTNKGSVCICVRWSKALEKDNPKDNNLRNKEICLSLQCPIFQFWMYFCYIFCLIIKYKFVDLDQSCLTSVKEIWYLPLVWLPCHIYIKLQSLPERNICTCIIVKLDSFNANCIWLFFITQTFCFCWDWTEADVQT